MKKTEAFLPLLLSLIIAVIHLVGCGGGGGGGGEKNKVPEIPPPLGTSTLISTDNTSNVFSLKVAMDPNGNAITVWEQPDGNQSKVWTNRYVAGTGWGIATTIATQNSNVVTDPQIAMDRNGNAIAVWLQKDIIGTQLIQNVVANRYVAGSGWGTVTTISPDTTNLSDLQFAMDPKGNAMAVWEEGFVGGKIWFNRYEVGVGWGTASLVPTSSNPSLTQVAVDSNQNFMVVWEQTDTGSFPPPTSIWTNRYVAETGWKTPTLISPIFSFSPSSSSSPQVALAGNGNAMAVWNQPDPSVGSKMWFNRYIADVGWDTATPISTSMVGTSTGVVLDPNGNATIIYQHLGEIGYNMVYAINYIVGAGWSDPSLISIEDYPGSPAPGGAQLFPDPSGGAIAVWQERELGYSLYTNRYVPGVGWGGPTPLITSDDANGNFSMAIDSNGNAITVYTHNNGIQTDVWANVTHF